MLFMRESKTIIKLTFDMIENNSEKLLAKVNYVLISN